MKLIVIKDFHTLFISGKITHSWEWWVEDENGIVGYKQKTIQLNHALTVDKKKFLKKYPDGKILFTDKTK